MGQYYKAVLIDDLEHPNILNVFESAGGFKLMETSWINNDFNNFVYKEIFNKPKHIAWIGDYADEYLAKGTTDSIIKTSLPDEIIDNKDGLLMKIIIDTFSTDGQGIKNCKFNMLNGYLVNETQQTYINIRHYVNNIKKHRRNYMLDWRFSDFIVNPLPLLTAIGNGLGGGDYYNGALNSNLVGTWALDKICFTKTKAKIKDMTYCDILFEE